MSFEKKDRFSRYEKWPYSYRNILSDFLSEPECLEKCVRKYFGETGKQLFSDLNLYFHHFNVRKIMFIGNTFNYYASFIPKSLFMSSKIETSFCWESIELTDFYDYLIPQEKSNDILFIFISNSGRSRILKKAINHLNLLKIDPRLIWLVTNNPQTSIASHCGLIFPIYVDSEIVLGTKSFLNTVLVLYLISLALLGESPLTIKNFDAILNLIKNLIDFRENWIIELQPLLNFIGYEFEFMYLISRDPASYSAAQLTALSAKSFARIMCEGITTGLFFHGPFQIFDRKQKSFNIRCILLDSGCLKEDSDENILRLIDLINLRAGNVVLFTNNEKFLTIFVNNPRIFVLNYNSSIPELSPIFQTFILQLIFLKISLKKKIIS